MGEHLESEGSAFASWGSDGGVGTPPPLPPLSPSVERKTVLGIGAMAVGAALIVLAVVRATRISSDGHPSSYQLGEVAGALAVILAAAFVLVWGLRRVRSSEPKPFFVNLSPRRRRLNLGVIAVILVLVIGGGLGGVVSGSSDTSWP